MVKSCYIHIPFCESICSYCDFCKQYYNKRIVQDYLKELKKEVSEIYQGEVLDTIYIGGGTPSCLDLDDLELLFNITDSLEKSSNYEFTIEGNFSSTTKEKLELYKKHKVNRLSLGIESIQKKNLEFLERNENKEEIINKISLMRSMGFSNINVDLIYAIPKEDIIDLEKDLNFILNLDVEHISTYSLIIEDNTKLKIRGVTNISSELDEKMYFLICDTLKKYGYYHYEISNFAKKGFESRHNLCYWLNHEYYGFGVGASSYYNNRRRENTRSISQYKKNRVISEEIIDLDSKIEYEIILGLRLLKGIDLYQFEKEYHFSLNNYYNYQLLIDNHLLVLSNNYLYIPEDKLYVSNEIIVKFLQNKK